MAPAGHTHRVPLGAGGAASAGPLAGVIVLPPPVVVPVRKALIPRLVVETPEPPPALVHWDVVRGVVEPISAAAPPFVLPDGNGTLFGRGRKYNVDGTTSEQVRDAIQAAALIDMWDIVEDLFELYGWSHEICQRCANAWRRKSDNGKWLFCQPCLKEKNPNMSFGDIKMYAHGAIKRNVV